MAARSVLEILLSLKGDKAREELKKVDKSLRQVQMAAMETSKQVEKSGKKMSSGFKEAFGDLKKNYLNLRTAATDVIQGIQKAWDFAKHGAAVQQTEQSWDFLLKKLGTAPGILDKMSQEARGTVDDMTIMSSTMTLLAGTSDELGKALLEQSPQLLKIAKAANKLNPSLGDTAFLYESISKGIKRASPLILDNLGLNIKMGEAFEAQAKSLGKSVDALTSEERAMAILNDTMRAGDLLIEQVGGNVDAAGDSMARAETASKNLGDQWSKFAAGPMAKVSEGLTDVIKGITVFYDEADELTKAQEAGIITSADYQHQLWLLKKGYIDTADVLRFISKKTAEYNEEIERVTSGLEYSKEAQRDFSWALLETGEAIDEVILSSDELTSAFSEMAGEMATTKDQFNEYNKAVKAVTETEVEAQRMKLLLKLSSEEFRLASKEEKKAIVESTLAHIDAIDRMEKLAQAFKDGKVAELDFKGAIADGIITQDEFNELLGYTDEGLHEVETGFGEVEEASDTFSSKTRSSTIPAIGELESSLFDANAQAALLEAGLIRASGDYEARFTLFVEQVGEIKLPKSQNFDLPTTPYIPPPISEDEGDKPRPIFGQHGLDFVVPPGYPGDSFFTPLAVSSGERVTVQTRSQQGRGRERIIYQRIGNINNFVQNSAAWAAWVDQQQQNEFDEIDRSL